MQVAFTNPPNYEEIAAAFNLRGKRGIFFAYGDTIHNPDRVTIPPQLVVHEMVHLSRQNGSPAAWWTQYISDPLFRLEEEKLAHVAEYGALMQLGANRHSRRAQFVGIAKRLSGPLYGNMISTDAAKRLLKEGVKCQ